MSKFSTVALTVAGVATVVVVAVAASATASTLPTITSSSSTFTSSTSGPPAETPTPTVTTTPTAETPDPNAVTADIYLVLGDSGEVGPTTFQVAGVTVGDGPELTVDNRTENPRESFCAPTVDVSLDPTTITVTGDAEGCYFDNAYVEVTLHGVEFSSTTVLSDNLFAPNSELAALGFAGGSYKARGVHLAASDPFPVLDSYGVTGNTFAAYWSGGASSPMNGAAVFRWVPVARAADGAAAAASFTG